MQQMLHFVSKFINVYERTNTNKGGEYAMAHFLYTAFTRSSKHRANVEQMYSKYIC